MVVWLLVSIQTEMNRERGGLHLQEMKAACFYQSIEIREWVFSSFLSFLLERRISKFSLDISERGEMERLLNFNFLLKDGDNMFAYWYVYFFSECLYRHGAQARSWYLLRGESKRSSKYFKSHLIPVLSSVF